MHFLLNKRMTLKTATVGVLAGAFLMAGGGAGERDHFHDDVVGA